MPYTDCNLTESGDCDRDVNVGISVMALCLGVILALSVAANGMVCFVFYRKSNLLSISNSFVLNLSCSELALSVLVLPFTLTSVFSSSGWIFNDIWCKIQGFIFSVCIFSIQFSLMVISLDRNYAIINSLRYVNVFTQKLANILIAMCWLLSLVLASLPLLNWGSYDYIPNQYTCAINWEVSSEFLTTVCVIVFLLPLLVQSICYLSIFKAAISHTKRSSRVYPSMPTSSIRGLTSSVQDPPSDSSDISDVSQNVQVKYQNMECKAVRTILLIAFTYAICWVPYMTVSFLRLRSVTIVSYSDSLAVCFLFLTGVINPIIYVFMNRIMRFEINRFFCGPSTRDSRKSSTGDDNDDFYSTTTMSVSIPKTTTTSSSSSSCQTRSGGKSRRIEMKTIKEEEVELQNVFKSSQFAKKAEKPSEEIENKSVNKEERKSELFLNPSDLYLQRKRIRTKRERLMSIREEASIPIQETLDSPDWQYLEDLDLAWNPSVSKDSHFQYRRRRSRINSLGAKKDETFSKKNRDSGSFLYFEHSSPTKGQHGQNRRSGRGLSVDEALFRFDNFPRRNQNRHHSLFEGMQTSLTVPMPELDTCRPHASVINISDNVLNCNAGSSVELCSKNNTGSNPELNRTKPSTSNQMTQGLIKDDSSTHLIQVSSQPKRNCLSA